MPDIGGKMPRAVAPGKQYGDTKRLELIGSGLKRKDGMVQERGKQGRPEGSGGGMPAQDANAMALEQAMYQVPENERGLMEEFARGKRVARVGESALALPTAGPWAALYAEAAGYRLIEKGVRLYTGTPFFTGV
jgi:hypothetical protein